MIVKKINIYLLKYNIIIDYNYSPPKIQDMSDVIISPYFMGFLREFLEISTLNHVWMCRKKQLERKELDMHSDEKSCNVY